jgi:hypothetical protein
VSDTPPSACGVRRFPVRYSLPATYSIHLSTRCQTCAPPYPTRRRCQTFHGGYCHALYQTFPPLRCQTLRLLRVRRSAFVRNYSVSDITPSPPPPLACSTPCLTLPTNHCPPAVPDASPLFTSTRCQTRPPSACGARRAPRTQAVPDASPRLRPLTYSTPCLTLPTVRFGARRFAPPSLRPPVLRRVRHAAVRLRCQTFSCPLFTARHLLYPLTARCQTCAPPYPTRRRCQTFHGGYCHALYQTFPPLRCQTLRPLHYAGETLLLIHAHSVPDALPRLPTRCQTRRRPPAVSDITPAPPPPARLFYAVPATLAVRLRCQTFRPASALACSTPCQTLPTNYLCAFSEIHTLLSIIRCW